MNEELPDAQREDGLSQNRHVAVTKRPAVDAKAGFPLHSKIASLRAKLTLDENEIHGYAHFQS